MNPNTNKWALDLSDVSNRKSDSEIAQRVAFAYGYKWQWNGADFFYVTTAGYLIFDPETKQISCTVDSPKDVCRIVWSFYEMLELFKNPPKNIVKIDGITLYKDGSVLTTTHGLNPMSSEAFERVLDARKKLMSS